MERLWNGYNDERLTLKSLARLLLNEGPDFSLTLTSRGDLESSLNFTEECCMTWWEPMQTATEHANSVLKGSQSDPGVKDRLFAHQSCTKLKKKFIYRFILYGLSVPLPPSIWYPSISIVQMHHINWPVQVNALDTFSHDLVYVAIIDTVKWFKQWTITTDSLTVQAC